VTIAWDEPEIMLHVFVLIAFTPQIIPRTFMRFTW
jgi:hypothetical protein